MIKYFIITSRLTL